MTTTLHATNSYTDIIACLIAGNLKPVLSPEHVDVALQQLKEVTLKSEELTKEGEEANTVIFDTKAAVTDALADPPPDDQQDPVQWENRFNEVNTKLEECTEQSTAFNTELTTLKTEREHANDKLRLAVAKWDNELDVIVDEGLDKLKNLKLDEATKQQIRKAIRQPDKLAKIIKVIDPQEVTGIKEALVALFQERKSRIESTVDEKTKVIEQQKVVVAKMEARIQRAMTMWTTLNDSVERLNKDVINKFPAVARKVPAHAKRFQK